MNIAHVLSRTAELENINIIEDNEIKWALRSLRRHLGMDVAFISNFVGNERFFVEVDTDLPTPPIRAGDSGPLEGSYCQRIVDRRLPYLISDTAKCPEAMELPVTRALPIGSHISVPLMMGDGSVYGTFCCFSHTPDPSLCERDLGMLRAAAEMTAHHIEAREMSRRQMAEKRRRVQQVLAEGGPTILYQPIALLADMRVVGVEALYRFSQEPRRATDVWLADADAVGLRTDLELAGIRNAIETWRGMWEQGRFQLNLNCSAKTAIDGRLANMLRAAPIEMIVLELSEQDEIEDYFELNRALEPLRSRGLKLAVDHAGSGHANLRRILNTKPDIIKLDISLIENIEADMMRRALAASMVSFADGFESSVVANGVRTEADLDTLRALGLRAAQGYHIARPMSLETFHRFLSTR